MEFPRSALIIQRVLALLMLAAALSAGVVERGSPLSNRIREGRLWPFWVFSREERAARFHLGIYDPVKRSVVLIHLPGDMKIQGKTTVNRAYLDALRASGEESSAARAVEDLAQARISELSLEPVAWEGAGRLTLPVEDRPEEEPGREPEVAAETAMALKTLGRSPKALLASAREALAGALDRDRTAADRFVLTLELRRVPLEELRPAWMPADAEAPAFLGRVLGPRAPRSADERPIVVEVLNGTDFPGLAAQASKVLVSRGVDVIAKGPAPRPRLRTVVYDRTGDFENAARVRAALGCQTAIAATRVDPLRGVDASVELGGDCSF